MDALKAQAVALWAKVVENKLTVIKVTGTVAGALLGAVVAGVIASNQEEREYLEHEEAILTEADWNPTPE